MLVLLECSQTVVCVWDLYNYMSVSLSVELIFQSVSCGLYTLAVNEIIPVLSKFLIAKVFLPYGSYISSTFLCSPKYCILGV